MLTFDHVEPSPLNASAQAHSSDSRETTDNVSQQKKQQHQRKDTDRTGGKNKSLNNPAEEEDVGL